MKLYHYTKACCATEILKDNTILLSNPEKLNDPFDCFVEPTQKEIDRCSNLIVCFYTFKSLYDIFVNNSMRTERLNGFLPTILKNELYMNAFFYKKNKLYQPIPLLDKVLRKELSKEKNNELRIRIDEGKQAFEKKLIEKIQEIRKKLVVGCFSKTNSSILMWSHYGDKHTGVCLEFDVDEKEFKKVKYSKKRVKFDIYKILQTVLSLVLSGVDVSLSDKELENKFLEAFYTKSKEWSYENEYRCFYLKDETNNSVVVKNDLYFKKMNKPTAIYFGCNASEKTKQDIARLCPDTPLFSFTQSDFEYNIDFQKAALNGTINKENDRF